MNENRRKKIYRGLEVQPTLDNTFVLTKNYQYNIDVMIPKGYKTNGADIPRWLWNIVPPFKPKYLPAVIVHDYYCDREEYKLADDLFREMLYKIEYNVKTRTMVMAVKLYHRIKYGVK